MVSRLMSSRRAELLSLVIVLAVIAILGSGAYILSRGSGSEISGFATAVTGCNTPILGSGAYELNNQLNCNPGESGINITVGNVRLDCKGNTITGDGIFGINISNGNNITVLNCRINGFQYGILVNASSTGSGINLSGNVLTGTTYDLQFTSPTQNLFNVSNNNFHGLGVGGLNNARCCVNGVGNFFIAGLSTSCGCEFKIYNATNGPPNQDFDSAGTFFSTDNVTIEWINVGSALPITYKVYVSDTDGATWSDDLGPVGTNRSAISVDDVVYADLMRFKVVPYDSAFDGPEYITKRFTIDNDADDDGYSPFFSLESDGWDCDDSNALIHQPMNLENDTNISLCFNAVDDDCDSGLDAGGIDWLDDGCGQGFNALGFSTDLYTNGSIKDISKAQRLDDSYYVLVNNSYGSVEYDSETDLRGVVLSSVFNIERNSISGDPLAYSGLFNKPAKVTFKNLTNKKVPAVLVDGEPCSDTVCYGYGPIPPEQFAGTLYFTAAHFSTFTTANNSKLETFLQTDAGASAYMSDAPKPIEPYHRVRFFANYSKFPSDDPINDLTGGFPDTNNNGSCNIFIYTPPPNSVLINRTDYAIYGEDFNDISFVPWQIVAPTYLNASLKNLGPVEGYVVRLDMVNNGCADLTACYGFNYDNFIANTSGKFYNVSFWAKTNMSGRNITVKLAEDSPGDGFVFTHNLTEEWQLFSFNFTFNNIGNSANLSFHLDNTNNQQYSVDIDDVSVTTNGTNKMTYDDFYKVYIYETGVDDFKYPSNYYRYVINCTSDIYEPLTVSEQFVVTTDNTMPIKPVLYPQILLHPDNMTETYSTYVAGYFNESDIAYTIVDLHGFWTYSFEGKGYYSTAYSEYTNNDLVVNFNSQKGQNVTFVAWNSRILDALHRFSYVEFSSHDRTFFSRYHISRANKTGDDIRIEFYEDLEADVPMGATMRLYTAPHPPGYFLRNVSLFGGSNRISVWGIDKNGIEGNASYDWITAPYPDTAPVAPTLWTLPEAVRNDTNFTIIGFINESSLDGLNMAVNFIQGDYFNYFFNDSFESSTLHREASLSWSNRSVNSSFVYINVLDYNEINATVSSWDDLWLEFSNHNRTYWLRYNVSNATKNPAEDPRVYFSPPLEHSVSMGDVAAFHSSQFRNGFFNITVDINDMFDGMNKMYLVGIRGATEGFPSANNYIYKDHLPPVFTFKYGYNYTGSSNPKLFFNMTDDFKVDKSTFLLNITNGSLTYYFDSTNITCYDTYENESLYYCYVQLNNTINGTYSMNFSVYDKAGWQTTHTSDNLTITITTVNILSVDDFDDITNDLWLYYSWTTNGGNLDYYEFSLGTAQYPEEGYDSIHVWNTSCAVLGACDQNWINFTHTKGTLNATQLEMKTGTVYYLTVRAKDITGEWGNTLSSDGVIFIDQTPPAMVAINDHGPWTNLNSRLAAEWQFEDNESDIIEYMYAVGNNTYPNLGYNSIMGPVSTSSASVLIDLLDLVENRTYYFSVKARNGNTGINYTGSWSPWYSSTGVKVDTLPPYGGFINWQNKSYSDLGFVTIQYYVGEDLPGTSDNVKGLIEVGRGPLINDVCPQISNFNWYNSSDILTGSSYKDVNVTSGYCYVFRLFVWDNVSNSVTYYTTNETLKVIKEDQTPPTDVAPVIDDGFYTNSRTSLHARWTASSDQETGFSNYSVIIRDQPVAGYPYCIINVSNATLTNCSVVFNTSLTNAEISINNLSLTHNHKYYFEVTAYNKAGKNSMSRYSDGIVYIDNAPPTPVTIYTVNEDDESSSPYFTENDTGFVRVIAYGDLDGYKDIDNCVLLSDDLDYAEEGPQVLANCTETSVWSSVNDFAFDLVNTTRLITEVDCNASSNQSGVAVQGTFSWYLSCRDYYWNTQSYSQNDIVWFTVDWPEPPVIDVSLRNAEATAPIYSDDDIVCEVYLSDPENDMNTSNITVNWKRNGFTILSHTVDAYGPLDGVYFLSDTLSRNLTARGDMIECNVTASDSRNKIGTNSSSVNITNYRPWYLSMFLPDHSTVSRNMSMYWLAPIDYVDYDFMTLQVLIDNETSFNLSDNSALAFEPVDVLTVNGIPIPNTQRNTDVFWKKIVYEDNRAGNWDVYLYDFDSDTETSIIASSLQQTNPHIYGDFVAYEEENGARSNVYLYDITNGNLLLVKASVNRSSMDFFGEYVVYNTGDKIEFYNVVDATRGTVYGSSASSNHTAVYGKDVLWIDMNGSAVVYDIGGNSSRIIAGDYSVGKMFGSRVALENSTSITIFDMFNLSATPVVIVGSEVDMDGSLVSYYNGSGLSVIDLDGPGIAGIGYGSNPVIGGMRVYFEAAQDVMYAERNISFPFSFTMEDQHSTLNPSSSFVVVMDTLQSLDGGYVWKIIACDNSFSNNSCYNGTTFITGNTTQYAEFTLDNTPPVITSVIPNDGSIVAGQFRVHALVSDNSGEDAVDVVNYTLRYVNGTFRANGSMTKFGSTWNGDDLLDFLDIALANFTLSVQAKDLGDNWAIPYIVNFTVNNATPWFLFGSGADEITDDGLKVFNDSIPSDFVAFNVLTSNLKIVGPLNQTTIRLIQTKTNLTPTTHTYSDDVSIITWPDGNYRVELNGSSLDDMRNRANRTFWVDKFFPQYSNNLPLAINASKLLSISVNWTDVTLRQVNFTHNNSDMSNMTQITETMNATTSGVFNSSLINVSAYINTSFQWYSVARDGLNRVNTSSVFSVFVESDAPVFSGTIPGINLSEDSVMTSGLPNISAYFTDVNTLGSLGYLDNLTFSATYDATNITILINSTTGKVLSVASANNFSGVVMVYFNATDYYGKMAYSNQVSVNVAPVNDAPYIDPIATVYTTEDNSTMIEYSLSGTDVEGSSLIWGVYSFDTSVLSSVANDSTSGKFNFTLKPNKFGVYNITFFASDGSNSSRANATVDIFGVNDAPVPGVFTNPALNTVRNGMITVSWTNASDNPDEGHVLAYHLSYSVDGGSNWNTIADYSVLLGNLSYQWNSPLNITAIENVTLKLNVSDGFNTSELIYGNFTVDNKAPAITIIKPKLINVGSSVTTDITTDELASCIFIINGTVMPYSTSNAVSHAVVVSGAFNTTYRLNISCSDGMGNSNYSAMFIEFRQTALEFVSAYVAPKWAYQGQPVNITLEIASNQTLVEGNLTLIRPDGSFEYLFTQTNFTPQINDSNKLTSLMNTVNTSLIGKYNLTVDMLNNSALQVTPSILIPNLFEVFAQTSQTLNIN